MVVLLTICMVFAEHQSAEQMHGNIDLTYVLSKQSGRLTRELAYLLMGTIGVFGVLSELKGRERLLRFNRPFEVAMFTLISWCMLSVLWTETPAITAKRLFVILLTFLGAMGISMSWTPSQILKFIAWSSAMQVGVGLVAELRFGYFTPLNSDYRFAGTLPWNSQGYLCLILTLASLGLTKRSQRGYQLYRVLAGFGFVFLLLTRSRSALTAFMLALTLYMLVAFNLKQRILTVIISTGLIATVLASGTAPALISMINRGGEGSENFTGRAPLWEELMTYVSHHPLVGYGFEGFWTEQRIDDVSTDQQWAIDTAHSGYIEELLSLGLIGTFLHTVLLLVGFAEGMRYFRYTGEYCFFFASALCFVYLIGGLLEALMVVKTSQSSYYFAILLCFLLRRVAYKPAPSAVSFKDVKILDRI